MIYETIEKYFDIFVEVLPELALLERFNQNDPKHIYDALEHTLVALKVVEPKLELRLATLFHDIGKPFTFSKNADGTSSYPDHAKKSADMAREIMNRLHFNKKTIQRVTKLIEYHDFQVPDNNEMRIKSLLTNLGPENLDDLFKIKKANFYAKNPAYVNELTKIENDYAILKSVARKASFVKRNEIKINGKELLNLGVTQEKVGAVLEKIYNQILEGKLKNNKEKLMEHITNVVIPSGYEGI